jgi:hypothetical protein
MKKNVHYIFLSLLFVLFYGSFAGLNAQNTCSGTIQASTLGAFGSSTRIGNGTPGNIRVCITSNAIGTAACMGSSESVVVSTAANAGVQVLFTSSTPVGTCFTFSTGTGFGFIGRFCWGAFSNATITWTTVNASGVPICPTCTDGIQNQGEIGVDCGGPCPACTGFCFDGIQNGTETGIDCGGTCPACPTCFDGIQNGGETGVDCGGPCALVCSTNATPVSSACGTCPATAQATIYPTNCDQVGTTAYNLNSPTLNAISCGSSVTPSPAPTCGTIGSEGTWIRVDLAPGVTQVQLAFNSGSVASGNSNTFAAAYQGTSCAALTPVVGGCQNSVQFISGSYGVFQNFFTGLNPNEDLWIFLYNDGGKAFNLNYSLVGTTGAPSNTTCGTSSTAIGNACNLGASGASFPTPGSAGVACSGGNWGSNENTTFYAFTATQTTASLTISNIRCNNGVTGQAQFAVWTSCASVGTYTAGSGFLGCAVGTGTINLTGLTAGQTYFIAADGFAGDNCRWTFTGNNIIILPVEFLDLKAELINNFVKISWTTDSEINSDYFIVERSKDGINFETVSTVQGAANTSSRNSYSVNDNNPYEGVTYYRIKQYDFDGYFKYSNIVAVNIKPIDETVVIYPNPVSVNGVLEISSAESTEQILSIFDVTGKLVYTKKYSLVAGKNQLILETNGLSRGVYFVKIGDINTKFIKE